MNSYSVDSRQKRRIDLEGSLDWKEWDAFGQTFQATFERGDDRAVLLRGGDALGEVLHYRWDVLDGRLVVRGLVCLRAPSDGQVDFRRVYGACRVWRDLREHERETFIR